MTTEGNSSAIALIDAILSAILFSIEVINVMEQTTMVIKNITNSGYM